MKDKNEKRNEKIRIIQGLLNRSINPFEIIAKRKAEDAEARENFMEMIFDGPEVVRIAGKNPEIKQQWSAEFNPFMDEYILRANTEHVKAWESTGSVKAFPVELQRHINDFNTRMLDQYKITK